MFFLSTGQPSSFTIKKVALMPSDGKKWPTPPHITLASFMNFVFQINFPPHLSHFYCMKMLAHIKQIMYWEGKVNVYSWGRGTLTPLPSQYEKVASTLYYVEGSQSESIPKCHSACTTWSKINGGLHWFSSHEIMNSISKINLTLVWKLEGSSLLCQELSLV